MSAEVQREGLEAVFDQDEQRLRAALANGFRLEEFRSRDRNLRWDPSVRSESPVSPFLRTINLNWYPGWQLLLNAFPDHIARAGATGFPILWETAVHKARRPMMQDLLQKGLDPQVRDTRQRSSIHLLFEGVREEALDRPRPEELVLCVKWLAGKGLDVVEPHPGEYHPQDLYKEGHTLWSYALTQDAWTVALALMPSHWEDVVRTPRWRQTLEYFRERCAAGKIRVGIGYEIWGRFLSRFLDDWMASTGDLLTDALTLPWIARLPPERRATVWTRWAQADATGRTGWHRVAQHAHQPEMAHLMALARADGGLRVEHWTQAEKYGERPMDTWAYALTGQRVPLPEDAWKVHLQMWKDLPAEALALTDEVHDPNVETLLAEVARDRHQATTRPKAFGNTTQQEFLEAFGRGAQAQPSRRVPSGT